MPQLISSARSFQTRQVPAHLLVPQGQLQAECDGLRVDPVGTPHHRRVLVAQRLLPQHRQELPHVVQQERAGILELQRQPRVHDVRGGHADVHETGVVTDGLGQAAQERDDLVVDLPLDLTDSGHVDAGVLTDARGGVPRHLAHAGQGLRGQNLDLQPLAEAVLLGPYPRHLGACVAIDHLTSRGLRHGYARTRHLVRMPSIRRPGLVLLRRRCGRNRPRHARMPEARPLLPNSPEKRAEPPSGLFDLRDGWSPVPRPG